jgi:membrane fusion protein (multidrug efflux system)
MLNKTKKKALIALGIFISIVATYIIYRNLNTKAPAQHFKIVEVEKVALADISQTIDLMGTIQSLHYANLTAKSKGVLQIFVGQDENIEKGTIIAKIENKDIENNYDILKESELVAMTQFDRTNNLFKSGIASQHDLEEKKNRLLDARKRLSDAKIDLEDQIIYAPFNGVIGIFKFRDGSSIKSGDVVLNFYDPVNLIVEFDIPLSVANQINQDSRVIIKDQTYNLSHIQKIIDEETRMCPAYVKISCDDCFIGSVVDVKIIVNQKKSVMVIDFDAVFFKSGNPFVFVVKDNKAIMKAVELGIREKQKVEISSGLEEGEEIIAIGHNRISDGMSVKIAD